jgi:hypothetical protein
MHKKKIIILYNMKKVLPGNMYHVLHIIVNFIKLNNVRNYYFFYMKQLYKIILII